jgi:hypothetical protein
MGRIFRVLLDSQKGEIYACKKCGTHLCEAADVVSRQFRGKHGQAMLVSRCENIFFGNAEEKLLMTGRHVVRDIFCRICETGFGWTYDFAHEERERHKVAKFVIENVFIESVGQVTAARVDED